MPGRVDEFIAELQDRVSPWSVAMIIGALNRVFDIVAPETDWSWLGPICADLKLIAQPSRNRFAHMVTPRQLFELGLSMMDEANQDRTGHPMHIATKARDGLIVAMLICCPVRIANLMQIEIGKHLLWDNDRYRLRFDKDETKTGREVEADLPPFLRRMLSGISGFIVLHCWRLARVGRPVGSGSTAGASRCPRERSGLRSSSIPSMPSDAIYGRICSVRLPLPGWSMKLRRQSASRPIFSRMQAPRRPVGTTSWRVRQEPIKGCRRHSWRGGQKPCGGLAVGMRQGQKTVGRKPFTA